VATITPYKKRSGELSYRAQVRIKQAGKIVFSKARSFPTEAAARSWAKRMEVESAKPGFIEEQQLGKTTIADLITRYKAELTEADSLGRTKGYTLDLLLRGSLADLQANALTSADLIEYCRLRAASGAGPATIEQDVIYLRTCIDYAMRAWKLALATTLAEINAATPSLRKLGLTAKSNHRNRRPTTDELELIMGWLARREQRINASIPHRDIVQFAIATCMRAGEIGRITWRDLDEQRRTVIIRKRKDPSNKHQNDQEVPLLGEAWEIVARQPRTDERIFPYKMKSVSAAFERAVKALGIADLCFHDLRHEGTSRLFEAGYLIQETAIVTGHKSWNNLKRYTQLDPASLHRDTPHNTKDKPASMESPAQAKVRRWVAKTEDGYLTRINNEIGWAERAEDAFLGKTKKEAELIGEESGELYVAEKILILCNRNENIAN